MTNNQKKQFIAELKSLVKPVGIACYEDGSSGVYFIVKFKDRYNEIKEKMISATDANELSKLKRFFVENNFMPSSAPNYYREIQNIIIESTTKKIYLVRTPGFYDNKYLLPDNTYIGASDGNRYMLDSSVKLNKPVVDEKGSLKEWKNEVAIFALNSSRLMLSLSTAFSAYILNCSKIENGGIHCSGPSSIGKTTILRLASSVQGPIENMESWGTTDTALEETAAARNDCLLILDELKLLDSNPKKAAEKASLIAYRLSEGKGKTRSRSYEDYALTWRLIILSAGEDSLSENAKNGKVKRYLGDEVRFVDVPADAGKNMGIYESLPDGIESPSQFSEAISTLTRKFYGTAQTAFLERFTRQLAKNTERVEAHVNQFMDTFLEKHAVDGQTGHEVRLAKRFALAYAGGIFAVKYNILPFTEEDVMEGISKCYIDSLKARPMSFDAKVSMARKSVLKALRSTVILDISKKDHGYSCKQLKSAKVFKSVISRKKVIIITTDYLSSLIPDDDVRKEVLVQFKSNGRLYSDAEGKSTRPINTKLRHCKLPRGYVFLPKSSMRY